MVRVHAMRVDVGALRLVRPVDVHRRELREERRVGRVGAVVDDQIAAARGDRAVLLDAALDLDDHALAALVGSEELLAAREHEAHRARGLAREHGDVRLVVEAALAAEAAAQDRHDDAHLAGGQLERVHDAAARRERHLRRGPDRDVVARPLRHDGARLDRDGVRAVGHEAALDDEVGIAHALLDVALDDRRVRGVVAVAHHAVGVAVGGPVDVHERRVGRQRGLDVVDDRQLLVLDLDQVDGLLRDLGRERGDGRDGVALVAHVLLAEEVAILHEVAVEHVRHVGVGRDGEHAGERLRLGRVEPRDAAVRHAGELELRVQHAREVQVGRVAARARDLVRAVCADEAPLGNGRQHCLLGIVRANAIVLGVRCRTSRAVSCTRSRSYSLLEFRTRRPAHDLLRAPVALFPFTLAPALEVGLGVGRTEAHRGLVDRDHEARVERGLGSALAVSRRDE